MSDDHRADGTIPARSGSSEQGGMISPKLSIILVGVVAIGGIVLMALVVLLLMLLR